MPQPRREEVELPPYSGRSIKVYDAAEKGNSTPTGGFIIEPFGINAVEDEGQAGERNMRSLTDSEVE